MRIYIMVCMEIWLYDIIMLFKVWKLLGFIMLFVVWKLLGLLCYLKYGMLFRKLFRLIDLLYDMKINYLYRMHVMVWYACYGNWLYGMIAKVLNWLYVLIDMLWLYVLNLIICSILNKFNK
jgi:hypothetical protein